MSKKYDPLDVNLDGRVDGLDLLLLDMIMEEEEDEEDEDDDKPPHRSSIF